jgi:purine-cytosine permease-like protein
MQKYFQKHFHALKTTDNHWLRKSIGVLLVIGGMLGFLPVLGYWMLPLGLALLAVDFPIARRMYRRLIVWWERRRRRFFAGNPAVETRRSPRPPGKPGH